MPERCADQRLLAQCRTGELSGFVSARGPLSSTNSIVATLSPQCGDNVGVIENPGELNHPLQIGSIEPTPASLPIVVTVCPQSLGRFCAAFTKHLGIYQTANLPVHEGEHSVRLGSDIPRCALHQRGDPLIWRVIDCG